MNNTFRPVRLNIELSKPLSFYLTYSWKGKRPTKREVQKKTVEVLEEVLEEAREELRCTGTFNEGRTLRQEEMRTKERAK